MFVKISKTPAGVTFGLLLMSIICFLIFSSCKTDIPAVDIKIWAGDSVSNSVRRAQENAQIACSDAQFDNLMCVTYDDFQKLYGLLARCKQWE